MSPTSDLWAAMEEMARGAGRILMDHFGKLAEGEVGVGGRSMTRVRGRVVLRTSQSSESRA